MFHLNEGPQPVGLAHMPTLETPRHFASPLRNRREPSGGALIVNADDWGRDRDNTDRIRECVVHGTVSSVSAMVFMEDSERAADIARAGAVDAGLHLNLTTRFSGGNASARLDDHHRRITSYLRGHRLAQAVYHPGLANSFRYVVASQVEEFARLYGATPARIDGHHHMHLCANVLWARLLPEGTIARRNFSFLPGEKSWMNRWYRKRIDRVLAKRHKLASYFYALPPIDVPGRLEGIFGLATRSVVEVETHPVNQVEYHFLMMDEPFRRFDLRSIVSFRSLL
jgi:predicted glycoside hydrolase/deacetylase ChbG (UPF0249 family)